MISNSNMFVINLISILILLFRVSKVSCDPKIVSDIVPPKEFCEDKQECFNMGCSGHIDCVGHLCSCVDNSKYMKDNNSYLNGCYWNITYSHPCRFNNDCADDGSICTDKPFGCNETNVSNIKTCQCPSNKEYVAGRCQAVITRVNGSECCSNNDCNENFECHLNSMYPYGQCKCKTGYALYKDHCISLEEAKICSRDSDCSEDFFCIKKSSEQHGTCREISMITPRVQCKTTQDCNKLGYFGHVECQNDYCLCSNGSKQIHLDSAQGCYMTSYYGQRCLYHHDCQNNLDCIHHDGEYFGICQCPINMNHYQNKCVHMPENQFGTFCQSNNECNATGLYCNKKPGSPHGRCQCYDGLYFREKCIEIKELGLCNGNDDCPRIEYCNKTAYNSIFGHCVSIKLAETYQQLKIDDFETSIDEPNTASVDTILVISIIIVTSLITVMLSILIYINTRGYFTRNRSNNYGNFRSHVEEDQESFTFVNLH